MKVVQINITGGSGSTGQICVAVSRLLTDQHIENIIFYSHGSSDVSVAVRYQKPYDVRFNTVKTRLCGDWGFEASSATRRLVKRMKQFEPDIVQLHNLHGHNINLKILFDYLRKSKVKVFWTFHDCWAFTGYCMHYDMIGCQKWQTGCKNCPQRSRFSWLFDRSSTLYRRKKKLFSELDMTIITPSCWMEREVKKSFLKDYPTKVIHNGVDTEIFRAVASDFRERYDLKEKKVILGVAFDWSSRKGLDVFVQLAERLPDDFHIVLVGTNERVEAQLPENVISIRRTQNKSELSAVYTAADVFVNPTREEVLGLTNLEALACGTPVVTFDTGGSPECINESCGIVVPKDDIDDLIRALTYICEERPFTAEACRKRARKFEQDKQFRQYLDLYTAVQNYV